MTMTPFLVMAVILFGLGIYTVCTRQNAVGYLMGIELILNAASLNFITFSHFQGNDVDGQVFALFVIALAACESIIALAIILGIYKNYKSIDTSMVSTLKG